MLGASDVRLALLISFTIPLQALRNSASKECERPACDEQYGQVRIRQSCDNPLVKHTAKNFNGFWDFGWQGLIAFPEQSFAFCTIPKNSCSSWLDVLEKIYFNDPDHSWSGDYQLRGKFTDAAARANVFNNPVATRAVFLRDPIARLASAFLNKCASKEDECPINVEMCSIRKIVAWALNAELDPFHQNEHWVMQSHFCDLKERINEYTFIGFMTKATLSRDARCMLEEAGLAKFGTVFTDDAAPTNEAVGIKEEHVLMKLFTKDAATKLIEKYADDYNTFGLPRPDWVESATGEWYDKVPSDSNAKTHQNRTMKEDEDDIVELASRFGYF